eukprot:169179-Pleurochrysis_carterae.AAC.1
MYLACSYELRPLLENLYAAGASALTTRTKSFVSLRHRRERGHKSSDLTRGSGIEAGAPLQRLGAASRASQKSSAMEAVSRASAEADPDPSGHLRQGVEAAS